MMERLKYPIDHEWHVAVNRHQEEQRKAGKSWGDARFMYDAKTMADEVPRMAGLVALSHEPLEVRFLHFYATNNEKTPHSQTNRWRRRRKIEKCSKP